jgi:formylglycine-generating enzyme required for sulfatase activity
MGKIYFHIFIILFIWGKAYAQRLITYKHTLTPNNTGEIVFIKGSTFQMGSPRNESGRGDDEKQHMVSVSDFYMGGYELTVAKFKQFIDSTAYRTDADKRTGDFGSRCWNKSSWENKDGVNW